MQCKRSVGLTVAMGRVGSGKSGQCPTLEQSTIDTLMTKTCSVNIDRKTVQGVSYRESALSITADYTQWCIQDFNAQRGTEVPSGVQGRNAGRGWEVPQKLKPLYK